MDTPRLNGSGPYYWKTFMTFVVIVGTVALVAFVQSNQAALESESVRTEWNAELLECRGTSAVWWNNPHYIVVPNDPECVPS
jgi:hypothetical protein